jgi:hypothetical protein
MPHAVASTTRDSSSQSAWRSNLRSQKKKVPMIRPAANAHSPRVHAEMMRAKLRKSVSDKLSCNRCVMQRPLRCTPVAMANLESLCEQVPPPSRPKRWQIGQHSCGYAPAVKSTQATTPIWARKIGANLLPPNPAYGTDVGHFPLVETGRGNEVERGRLKTVECSPRFASG